MVFSSIPFLFLFFPMFLLVYFLAPRKFKNFILMVFSLVFYAWGEPIYIVLMIFSSLWDFVISKKIEKHKRVIKKKKLYLVLSIVINLLSLGFFKYADFLITNINNIFNISIPLLKLGLPIGISFYTFQTMSYTIDVYREEIPAERNFINYLTYVSMFPQLIAGPIVRYETIHKELKERTTNIFEISEGFLRFLRGIFKKVLIANNIGYLFSLISVLPNNEMSVLTSWLGIFAFGFQIYFDFSGYSDMAIGMGRMLGFHYLENFDYPYISKSITEFWRRWHISLSTFFKDYLYIPLGGSRVKKIVNIRNILIVWILTGLWHGAAWNFIIWGIYYGIILVLEKFILNKYIEKLPNFFKHLYTLFLVFIGWMIFAFDDVNRLSSFTKIMFGFEDVKFIDTTFLYYIKNYFIIILLASIFSTPIYLKAKELFSKFKFKKLLFITTVAIYLYLFIISISYLISDTYNPFLYFRF